MATNAQARLPATAEFDAKLAKMYDKALTEVQRHLRKTVRSFTLDINDILLPTQNEQEEARVARKFTKKRLKILDTMDTFIRNLIMGRNRVSLFDMFDENTPMKKSYSRRYNRVKMQALSRLETGVSLIKFERQQDLPLSTILFPSRNTKFYTARYELLKHSLLTKVNKGIRHIQFTAPVAHKSFKLTKIEKTQAEVPIDAFLIPTPNTAFFTARYNWAKHILLNKVHQGIKNLQFVAPYEHKSFKLTKIEKQRKEVPIDLFLMPTGNSWYYSAKYELAKLKLLRKVKKGINSIEFENEGKVNLIDHFMPEVNGSGEVQHIIGKAIAKNMTRESKARSSATRRAARINEYQVHKQEKRLDKQLELDMERNRILMAFFNMGGSGGMTDMTQGRDGVWKQGVGSRAKGLLGNVGSGVAGAMISKGPAIAKAMGPALGVAAAGAIGYGIGKVLDKKFGISDSIASGVTSAQMRAHDKRFMNTQAAEALADMDNWRLRKHYRDLGGGDGQSTTENRKLYEAAMGRTIREQGRRRQAFDAAGIPYTMSDVRSSLPIDEVIRVANGGEPTIYPGASKPAGTDDYFNNVYNNTSGVNMDAVVSELQKLNANQRNNGNTIINSRPNPDQNLNETLDFQLIWNN
jgi:hypothetical protein